MGKRLLTFGPKDFLKGIGPLQTQQNEMGGFFAQTSGIDMFRNPGMITPGSMGTLFTNNSSLDGPLKSIDGLFLDGSVFTAFGSTSAKFFKFIFNSTPPTLYTTAPFPYTFTSGNAAGNHSIISYAINGTVKTLVFKGLDIDLYDNNATITNNWGSTVCSGGVGLQGVFARSFHRAVVFNGYCYFTNGSYVGFIDGTTATGGVNGTMYASKLALPTGYVARDIRVVQGNLEIYIDNNADAQVWTWDGISTLPLDIAPIEDQAFSGAITNNGIPHIFTYGQGTGLKVRQKNFYGYPPLQTILASGVDLTTVPPVLIDRTNGLLVFSDTSKLWTYGDSYAQYSYRGQDANQQFPESLQCPIIPKGTTIDAIKCLQGQIIVGSHTGSNYYVESFVINDSTYDNNATWQTNFIQIPDDSTIDFVRFVVKPLSTGAIFIPSLYTDYSTSPTSPTMASLTPTTLDANGKSKTYYADQLGAPICDNFAIGGAYTGSSTSNPVVIVRIDVGINTKS